MVDAVCALRRDCGGGSRLDPYRRLLLNSIGLKKNIKNAAKVGARESQVAFTNLNQFFGIS